MTLQEAIKASKQGKLKEWVYEFIMNEHSKHIEFYNELQSEERYFFGPIRISLKDLKRIAGPENEMEYTVPDDWWNNQIPLLKGLIEDGWDMPPLIIRIRDDGYYLTDGNHRLEALRRLQYEEYYAIFWVSLIDYHKYEDEILELRKKIEY